MSRKRSAARSVRWPISWRNSDGTKVLLESSHELPLVDFEIGFGVGSFHDPPGKEGLARLTAQAIRMGPEGMSAKRFDEEIARLGARLSIDVSPRATRIRGSVLERSIEPFIALVSAAIQRPGFRERDFAQIKRETQAALVSLLDDDRALAATQFRSVLFAGHPFGRRVSGDRTSLRHISRDDVLRFYGRRLQHARVVIGASGAIHRTSLEHLVEQYFTGRPRNLIDEVAIPAPRIPPGKRVIIVDKPNRSQVQLFIGTLGAKTLDPHLFPLIVSNTAFGGMFSSRLMQEVRAKRGWSYGAHSTLSHEQQRDSWHMWSFPAASYAAECATLEIDLLQKWVDRGLSSEECSFAKRYLINSHCFEVDTPSKRLDAEMEVALLGVPRRYVHNFSDLVNDVKLSQAREATRRRISTKDLLILIVATAQEVAAKFERIKGVTSLEVIPYDA